MLMKVTLVDTNGTQLQGAVDADRIVRINELPGRNLSVIIFENNDGIRVRHTVEAIAAAIEDFTHPKVDDRPYASEPKYCAGATVYASEHSALPGRVLDVSSQPVSIPDEDGHCLRLEWEYRITFTEEPADAVWLFESALTSTPPKTD
jgi:hypothetical protein